MTRRLAVVVAVLAVTVTVTACTGVPTSSTPQVIQTVPLVQPQQPAVVTPQVKLVPAVIDANDISGTTATGVVDIAGVFIANSRQSLWPQQ